MFIFNFVLCSLGRNLKLRNCSDEMLWGYETVCWKVDDEASRKNLKNSISWRCFRKETEKVMNSNELTWTLKCEKET